MARRIRSRKFRHRGNRTHGSGNKKNRRGKGNKGGVGRAGYHKHRRMHFIKLEGSTKRDKGLHGFTNPAKKVYATVSLGQLQKSIDKFPKNDQGVYQVVIPRTKVLSGGQLSAKAHVTAYGFSAKAKEKIENAGGTIATT